MKELKFKVWWIPQLPMENSFEVEVPSREEGLRLCDILANYDIFQFENSIKPDYCNTGGVVYRHDEMPADEWHDVPEDDEEWKWLMEEDEAA